MKLGTKGFGAVGLIIVLVAIGLAGLASWLVWDKQIADNITDTSLSSQPEMNNSVEAKANSDKTVSLDESKLPAGWTVGYNETSAIMVENKSNGCYVNVVSTADTAESNSPDIDHASVSIDGIKSKGYTVTQLSAGELAIASNRGTQKLTTTEIDLAGFDNPMSQSMAFISTKERYTSVTLSCTKRTDIETASKTVLPAISLRL